MGLRVYVFETMVRKFVAEFHQRTNGRRGSVEHGDLVILTDFPEAACIRDHRCAFIDHGCRAGSQRAVGNIGMAGDPADIGGTPEYVIPLQVEHPQVGLDRVEQVTAAGVLYALGFACRARGVEQEQRMFRSHPFRLAGIRLALDDIVPPVVTPFLHVDVMAGTLKHDDVLDTVAMLLKRLVGG